MPGPRPRLRTTASRSGAPCLREPLHGAAAASGAGPSHALRRLVTDSAHGTKADRSKGRPRRSYSRVRVGRVTPTVVLERFRLREVSSFRPAPTVQFSTGVDIGRA